MLKLNAQVTYCQKLHRDRHFEPGFDLGVVVDVLFDHHQQNDTHQWCYQGHRICCWNVHKEVTVGLENHNNNKMLLCWKLNLKVYSHLLLGFYYNKKCIKRDQKQKKASQDWKTKYNSHQFFSVDLWFSLLKTEAWKSHTHCSECCHFDQVVMLST